MIIDALVDLVHDKAYEEGMPNLRLAFTHTPVGGKTRKELDAYIAGEDPVSKRPFMEELKDYLTRPLNDEEKKTGTVKREKKRLISSTIGLNASFVMNIVAGGAWP